MTAHQAPHLVAGVQDSLRPRSVRQRMQLLFLAMNWLVAVVAIPVVLLGSGVATSRRIEALVALAGLEAWLVVGYLLRRFPLWLDAAALVGLVVFSRGFVEPTIALVVFYYSLWVRGMDRSWRGTATAALTFVAAFIVSEVLAGVTTVSLVVVLQVVGLNGTAFLTAAMSAMLDRGDRGHQIQRQLSELGARLVAAKDPATLLEAATTTAFKMVPAESTAAAVTRLESSTLRAARTADGRFVLTPGIPEPRAGQALVSSDVVIEGELVGRVTLTMAREFAAELQVPIDTVATELGFALQRIRLTESLRRESQAKSQFLATMSHEFRTPLHSIIGFAQLLGGEGNEPLTQRQARFVARIMTSGHHLLTLINEVLDLSTVAGGHLKLSIESFDAGFLVDEALVKVKPMADLKQIQLLRIPGRTTGISADRFRTEQILLNLLSNAIKFTPAGASVTVRHRRVSGSVEICVRDFGIGIAKTQKARIFEAFTQLNAGRARTQEGTGLGLALSRHLAEAMDGEIRVVSTVGKGSAFLVRLPQAHRAS